MLKNIVQKLMQNMQNKKHIIWVAVVIGFFLSLVMFLVYEKFIGSDISNNIITINKIEEVAAEKSGIIPKQKIITIDGREISLPMFTGKAIMLNFWATWCSPCRAEIPDMLNLAREHGDKMVLIMVSSDKSEEVVTNYLNSLTNNSEEDGVTINNKNVYWVRDKDRILFQKMSNSQNIPTTFIISKQQKIIKKIVGKFDWTSADIREKLYIIANSR